MKLDIERRQYEKPSVKVVKLQRRVTLLQNSRLGNPNDYPSGGNPFNF